MIKTIDDKVKEKLNKNIEKLKATDLKHPQIALANKDNRWLASYFDSAINNFYDEDLKKEVLDIPLPNNIKKEVYLYEWIKVHDYQGLKDNFAKTQDFLFNINSPFYDRLNFYRYEFNKADIDLNMLYKDFMTNWEGLLIKRILDYRFAKIEEKRQKFMGELFNRYEVIKKTNRLLKTIWNFFGMMWDPSKVMLRQTDMKALENFALFLEQNPSIMQIATLLGRYQGESRLIEERIAEEIIMDYEWKPIGSSPEEIIGATESNDIEHMLPSELALLKDENLKKIFYKKFVEKKLVTFEFMSQDQVPIEVVKLNIVKTRVPEEKGPIILCIDTSTSMRGNPEQIAKALALAIAKIATTEKRPCYMINFSSDLDVYDFSNVKNSLPNIIKFLSRSFSGDTDIDVALEHAIKVMDKHDYFNADLLVITDFIVADLSSSLVDKIEHLKKRRNRFHSIAIGSMGNENTQKVFNNTWIYDPRDSFVNEKIINALTNEFQDKYHKAIEKSQEIRSKQESRSL